MSTLMTDAASKNLSVLSEKARRLLAAHDREVADEKPEGREPALRQANESPETTN